SYLCCQFEDPAERVHRTGPIWGGLCFPVPSYDHHVDLDYLAREKQESFIMVNIAEMPEVTSPTIVNQPKPFPEQPEQTERAMIEVEHLYFAYGSHQVLHDVHLNIPSRAVTAF